MALQFVNKHFMAKPNIKMAAIIAHKTKEVKQLPIVDEIVEQPKMEKIEEKPKRKNKKAKKNTTMDAIEQIKAAEATVAEMSPEVKIVKKDRGLIERTESSKIILTEDNRQVLND